MLIMDPTRTYEVEHDKASDYAAAVAPDDV
jgi:hypothetical protein